MLFIALATLLLSSSQASLPPAPNTNDAEALLRRALEHSDFFNWADAGPEFRQAENLFLARHDERNALYAEVGFVRASMEDRSLTDVQNQLGAIIARPEVQRDPELLLFSLIAKADADGEIDAQQSKNDWIAIEQLAKAQNNSKWSIRALGEQSLSEFLTGNISRGRILIATALGGTQKAGDVGGQIRYLTAIGAALAQTHQFEQALEYLSKAADLVQSHPQTGYPFVTYEYKLEALVGLKDFRTAETLAEEIITAATRRNKKVKQAQAMITLARLQDQTHRTDQAISTLNAASSLAAAGNFKRLLADTQYALADLYRARGDNRTAEVYLTRGLQITQDTSELWLMPSRLQSLAQLKVADGRYREADQLYHRATDLIDTLLGGTTNPQAELGLVAVNSEIFVQHFELAADHLKNTDDAYRVIEGARGRTALDMLRGAFPPNRSKANPIDQNISRLRQQLAQAQNVKRRAQLKAAIFRDEQQRWTADASVNETVRRVADIVPLRCVWQLHLAHSWQFNLAHPGC